MNKIQQALENRVVRQVHSQAKIPFLPIAPRDGATVYQADLMFFGDYASQNDGYDTLLTIICVGSRYAYVIPLKGKKAETVAQGMRVFLKDLHARDQKITRIEVDGGGEFLGPCKRLLTEHGVTMNVVAPNDTPKKGIVERLNQTVRGWVERYLTTQNTNRWIDAMDDLVEYYNNRVHKTTHRAPAEMGADDIERVREGIVEKAASTRARYNDLRAGDTVRLLLSRDDFGKGRKRWSDSVHKIKERVFNTNSFYVSGHPDSWKYSQLQVVARGSEPAVGKTVETVAHAEKRTHAKALGRTGLARGPREGAELIDRVAEMPVGRPTRERRAPARYNV